MHNDCGLQGRVRRYDGMQGVLAYVFVRPTLAAIQLICMMLDAHGLGDAWGEGKFTFRKWWLWCQLINNVAQVRCCTGC
jgi:hypothetical protein